MLKNTIFFILFMSFNSVAQEVAIDIGHNINAPGATSAYGETELSYNAALASYIYPSLNDAGFKTKIINKDLNILSLSDRARFASKSDFFVSVHHDSTEEYNLKTWTLDNNTYKYNDNVQGFSIFVSNKNPFYMKSKQCAEDIAKEYIKAGFVPNLSHKKKRELLNPELGVYNYPDLVVLKTNTIPAILIETGVIINREEAEWLKKNEVRWAAAYAIRNGLLACLNMNN